MGRKPQTVLQDKTYLRATPVFEITASLNRPRMTGGATDTDTAYRRSGDVCKDGVANSRVSGNHLREVELTT